MLLWNSLSIVKWHKGRRLFQPSYFYGKNAMRNRDCRVRIRGAIQASEDFN